MFQEKEQNTSHNPIGFIIQKAEFTLKNPICNQRYVKYTHFFEM